MSRIGVVVFGAIVLILAGARLEGQTRVANPHGSLSLACAQCHGATSWTPARPSREFRHAPNRFPLDGAHAQAECSSCHRSLVFTDVRTACGNCHSDVPRGELGRDCARCHTTRTFIDRGAMARTHQSTRFPLSAAHAAVDCSACHRPTAQGGLQFVNRSTDCVSCHRSAASATKNPDHTAAGFSQQCERCHAPTLWNRARYDHAASRFPLTGAHSSVSCARCHTTGTYTGTPTACVSCHQADYNRTTNPSHTAAGFPDTCASCHNTAAWTGARFDHDQRYFPIYSGKHQGQWSSCGTCHQSASNFAQFTCLTCHTHNQTETDGHHRGISGYRYDSQSCYACHRNGRKP
jgi:hypothetical protein